MSLEPGTGMRARVITVLVVSVSGLIAVEAVAWDAAEFCRLIGGGWLEATEDADWFVEQFQ